MNRYFYILISLFILCSSLASGQNKINSTVEVKREYEGKLIGVVKSPLSTKYSDTLQKFNLNFDYSIFDPTYKDLYEFSPMRSAHLTRLGTPQYPWLFLKAGMAYPWMPSADLYIQPRFGYRFSLLFYYNHNSFWGKIPAMNDIKGDRMVNSGGVEGKFSWEKGLLQFGAGYSNNYYTYYGHSTPYLNNDISSHTFDNLNAFIRVRSTNDTPNSFYYDINLKYNYLADKYSLAAMNEHFIDADVQIGATIKKVHKFLIETKSSTVLNNVNSTFQSTRGFLELTPMYRWEKNRWRIKAGASFAFPYSSGQVDKFPVANVYPNVHVSFEAARNSFWLYGKVDGKNEVWSYSSLFMKNPWLTNQAGYYSTATPLNLELGLRGVVKDKFSYNLFGSYSIVNNMLTFASAAMAGSQIINGVDSHVFNAGAEIEWKSKDFMCAADVGYHYYTESDQALMLPTFDASLVAIYNIRQRLFFKLNCQYTGSMTGKEITNYEMNVDVSPFVDLGLEITYSFNNSLSFFIEGNNLINSKIQYFLNYVQPGMNFGLGLCLKL